MTTEATTTTEKGLTVLHVQGEGDFSAMFVEDEYGVDDAYQLALELDGGFEGEIYANGESNYVALTIREFDNVDPEFIGFVQNFIDYDFSKRENFYVITDEMRGDD